VSTDESTAFETSIRPLSDVPEWYGLAVEGRGATVFHEEWFLNELGARQLLCVSSLAKGLSKGRLLACLPLFEGEDGRMEQSSLSSPYAGPVFGWPRSRDTRTSLVERRLMGAIARSLQCHYRCVSFSLSPQITDVVAFLRAGFVPEVRYTYVVDVSGGAGQCASRMSPRRRTDLARARKCGLTVTEDANLQLFDVARAVRWAPCANYADSTRTLLRRAISCNRGRAFVALSSGLPVAGLFLVWDRLRSYTTHAWLHEDAARTGASTLLYLEAMSFTRERLMLDSVDLEGSVVPGVEEFYQSFGGLQTIYFRLHWDADRALLMARDLYDYS
jgi:hypothetical protein